MKIGKFIRIENDDFVYDGLNIYRIIENKSEHPYLLNKFCMYQIVFVYNRTDKQSKEYAKLITWDQQYDWETGRLKTS
jgi:hypothetical protein